MSLILEALKKLDREKKAPERGFLVVGAAPWPARPERRWLAGLLVLAGTGAVASAIWLAWPDRGRDGAPAASASLATPATLAAAPAASPPPAASAEPLVRVPEAFRPPSRAVAAKPSAARSDASTLRLEAIGERDGKPVAILSQRLVHEGDRFDGVTVVRIGVDEVEVEVQGRRRVLRF